MSDILAIHSGHNASVALFRDGACLALLHEEKFSNSKNHTGFPHQALSYVYRLYQPVVEQVVVFGRTHFSFESPEWSTPSSSSETLYEDLLAGGSLRRWHNRLEYRLRFRRAFRTARNYVVEHAIAARTRRHFEVWLQDKYHIAPACIRYVEHHLAHAWTPVYFYGLWDEELLVFTMDGAGDGLFATVNRYEPRSRSMTRLAASPYDASLGLLYSEATKFLGMKPNEHEYKVMGLAAYVTDEKYYRHIYDKLAGIVWLDEGTLTFGSRFNTNVAELFFREQLTGQRFDNISAAVQHLTEDLVTRWISAAIRRYGCSRIALAGGVFMNVKMNQRIAELPEVKKVYLQPSCGDDSGVIGSAASVGPVRTGIRTMCLGQSYTDDEVEKFLREQKWFDKYRVDHHDQVEKEVARLLAEFHVVARFKGRGEWGARSLCNRAILGNASDFRTFHEVNDMIKMRDFWMPFAPVILEEWASRYIRNWAELRERTLESSRYMIITYDSTELAQEHLRAALHQKDKTIRPQVLSIADNEDMHRLLKAFEGLTGMGGMLNTSLNIHGYPLVGTLEQAAFTFENSGLRHMAIEHFLVSKR